MSAPSVTVEVSAEPPRARLAAAVPADQVVLPAKQEGSVSASESPYRLLPVASISPNPFQPRKQFELKALEQLAASIRLDGVIQPIVVRLKPGLGPAAAEQYELIAGERRWRASQLADQATIPAIVRTLTDRETAEWALVENLQREDLNPIERAEAFQQLVSRYELSHEQVADRVGVERSTITNTLRLLGLHGDVQQFIRDGLLSAGQARAVAGIEDAEAQRALAIQAVRQSWSVRQVEQAVREITETANASTTPAGKRRPSSAHIAELEQQIGQQLGTKIHLHQGKKKGTGTLSIEFYTPDQFEDLLGKLGVRIAES